MNPDQGNTIAVIMAFDRQNRELAGRVHGYNLTGGSEELDSTMDFGSTTQHFNIIRSHQKPIIFPRAEEGKHSRTSV